MGVSDLEHILKESRQIQKYQSSPSLCTVDQFDLVLPFAHLEEEKQNLSWSIPTIPVDSFQVFTNLWSYKKAKTESLGKIPLFQFKTSKIPFQPGFSKLNKIFPSLNQSSSKTVEQRLDMMDRMVATRYAPLVLHQPLNSLPGGDYHKYLPMLNGQSETTIEEHWDAFLSYADNQNIEAKDVWMRMFV